MSNIPSYDIFVDILLQLKLIEHLIKHVPIRISGSSISMRSSEDDGNEYRGPWDAEVLEELVEEDGDTNSFMLDIRKVGRGFTFSEVPMAFEEHGEIEEAYVVRHRDTRISKNYGFVTYKDVKSVQDALIRPRKVIDGSMAVCDVADGSHGKTNTSSDPDLPLGRKLYIGNLAAGVTTENLRSDFQMHGEIVEAVAMKTARFGFVTYMTAEAAKKAIDYNTLHPTFAEGRKRIVKYANPPRGRRVSRRNPNPEYQQFEDDYVDSHSAYETYGVSYPRLSAMTDQFGTRYYYDYSYPYQ
ncbi:UBP1-associated protein 2C-like [Vicia villosa]|uniref:UBP1-associated protein 2C-like n=1 Tax=Vicia villosa TaxID=3911 RepID=UPI00273ADFAB|nr:UBP1-associated protein 2C-like [Vicia villosa]